MTAPITTTLPVGSTRRPSPWRRLRRNRLACASLVFICLVLVGSALAPWLAPYDPNFSQPRLRLGGLGTPGHWLGLDAQGRDLFSRVLWGGRSALLACLPPVLGAALLALLLGLFAGFRQGRMSALIMRTLDMLLAFPMVLLAIGLATVFGPGLAAVSLTILFSALPYLARVVYAEVKAERDKEYLEAARALGASPRELLVQELLPNVLTGVVVYATTLVGGMLVFLAGLSFMGLGVQPPQADWGRMVSEGATVMLQGHAHVATVPALAIVAVALAFNWLGDGLRDVLDPRD
ncbi:ABC transporter permease [Pseudomonas typographi]|uniref:ABC transporter permease n=1 Tax=Pseudomonas typographi TaxID=2715964 RepID=A0ABR7YWV4_9PSED|nr:ABC transporter permease [Pseudomonas typographi]MBD1597668.1 ABC transporter permease [Pseudomonas typographi]